MAPLSETDVPIGSEDRAADSKDCIITLDVSEKPACSMPDPALERDAPSLPPVDGERLWQDTLDLARSEIESECQRTSESLNSSKGDASVLAHGSSALATMELISEVLHCGDEDIKRIVSDTRGELLGAYVEAYAGRNSVALILLRGVFEGIFTCLYYRQQAMSLRLWAAGEDFDMAHELLSEKHVFYKYYKSLFSDERYKQDYGKYALPYKKIVKEAVAVYKTLSNNIHKKRTREPANFLALVERLFRISLVFIEREEEIPESVLFPTPLTYSARS